MARAAKAIKDTADAAVEAGAETRKSAGATGDTVRKAAEDVAAAARDGQERTADAMSDAISDGMSAAAPSALPDHLQGVTEPAAAAASTMMSAAATLPRAAAEMMPAMAGAGPRMAMQATPLAMQATPWAMGPWAVMPAMMALSLHAMAAATAFWTWPLSGAPAPSAGRPRP